MQDAKSLATLQDVHVDILSVHGLAHAVRGVSMDIKRGTIHGIVGESGCGKTMTAKTIMQLHEKKRTFVTGRVLFGQERADILTLGAKQMLDIRGKRVSMVFQDPLTTMNPLITVGRQICEMIIRHKGLSRDAARQKAIALLERVGIHPAKDRFHQYPFELSGGMLQRVIIAMAISCDPELLIADEPTTALDVTMQAQILDLMKSLQQETGMSILIITHNFGVVAEICDEVSVMYAGKIIESGDVRAIFHDPRHPYTRALLNSIPQKGSGSKRMIAIPGSPPNLLEAVTGCSFYDRCEHAQPDCKQDEPDLLPCAANHLVACILCRNDKEGRGVA